MGPEYRHFARSRARKRLKLRIAACAALAAAACMSAPACAQSATAESFANIVIPGTVAATRDMNFGEIVQPSSPGTVTVTAADAATCTASSSLVRTGTCSSARFDGTVRWFFPLQVTPPTPSTITLTGPGGATMTVDNFTIQPGPGLASLFGSYWIINGDGSYSLFVGGRLHVKANQAPGTYHGTFQIQLNYD
jgi:hypothetical protein